MQEEDLKQEIQIIDEETKALIISSPETLGIARNEVFRIKEICKKWDKYWNPRIKEAWQLHKNLKAMHDEPIRPLIEREEKLRKDSSKYQTEQENKRREAQRKLDSERLKKEEAERKRLEDRATRAEEKGKPEKAEQLREKADEIFIPPAIVEPEILKTTRTDAGTVSQKKDIEIEIFDPMVIVQAVASRQLPIGIITISKTKLKQVIKLQGITNLDGCRIRELVTDQYRGKTA